MKKQFVSNLAFLVFVNVLVKPFWIFGIDMTVQNMVGAESYGLYFALFNFSLLFHIVLDFGINNFNNRSVAQDTGFLKNYFPNILLLKSALALLYVIITVFCAFFLGFNEHEVKLLSILAFNQMLLSLVLYLRSNISGMHFFRIDSLLSVLDRLLMIAICSALIWGRWGVGFTIERFVYAQTASLIITAVVALFIVLLKAGKLKIAWDFSKVKEIVRSSYPYALLGLLMSIYYRIDGVMIERMLPEDGAYEAGVYAASYRLLDAANMLGFLFATLLLPMFSRMLHEKKDVRELLHLGFKMLFSFAAFLSLICFFYREQIIHLLYREADSYWWRIFGTLIFAYLGICVVYIYGTLLTANGSLKWLNIIAVSGMILNIVLNFILIKDHKAMGATVATVITQSLVALAHVVVAKKVFRLDVSWRPVTVFMMFIGGMALINFMMISLPVDWKISFVISALACFVLALLLKIFDLKRAFSLLKPLRD